MIGKDKVTSLSFAEAQYSKQILAVSSQWTSCFDREGGFGFRRITVEVRGEGIVPPTADSDR